MNTSAEHTAASLLQQEVSGAATAATIAPTRRSLKEDASWTLIGQVSYAACLLGWMALISKFCSEDSRGRYVLATATANPIIAFAALGLRQMLATDVRHEHHFSWYLYLRIFFATLGFAAMVALAWLQPWATAIMFVVVSLFKSLESISDLLFGRMQQFGRFDRIAFSQIIRGIVSLVLLATGIVLTHNALGAACGVALAFLLTLVVYDFPTANRLSEHVGEAHSSSVSKSTSSEIAQYWAFIKHTIPLALATTLVMLNLNMPVYFLRGTFHEKSEAMIGIYGALSYLPQVGTILMNAVGVAASTRLACLYAEGRIRAFYKLAGKLVLFCAAIGLAGVLVTLVAGKLVITILYKQEDAVHLPVLIWLVISNAFSFVAGMLGYTVTATRRFHHFVIPYLCVTIIAAAAAILLIPRYGLLGAAWSNAIMNIASCFAPLLILASLHRSAPHGKSA